MKALVTGATGLVGRELLKALQAPVVLSRAAGEAKAKLGPSVSAWQWQPEAELAPTEAFAGVDTVFHLAGEPVAEGRWTPAKKQRIRASRVLGTHNLVAALAQLPTPPRVLVAASGVDYYGDTGDALVDERTGPGTSFLSEVCQAWEAEVKAAERYGVRVVLARFGMVLAPQGGALARMLPIFRLGVGGKLGSGSHWLGWVHIEDVVGLLLHAAHHDTLSGPMNVVSPEPVTNAEFTGQLGRALGRPTPLSVPRFALRAAYGELSDALFASHRVVPRAARESGYEFAYTELQRALEDTVRGPSVTAAPES